METTRPLLNVGAFLGLHLCRVWAPGMIEADTHGRPPPQFSGTSMLAINKFRRRA